MKGLRRNALDFKVDKLTNSIENAITGEVFDTTIVRMTIEGIVEINNRDW